MRRWAVLLPALLLAAAGGAGGEAGDEAGDGDSAPFMVVVRGAGGRRCAGSLVSRSTALTAAACTRGAGALWASAGGGAGGAGARRRVLRVLGGADLALLELERPFAEAARARTILMAMEAGECGARGAGAVCHAVRLLGGRLRIVDATLAPPADCGAAPSDLERDRVFCLTGPEMCDSDIGTGVVCGGKLCGVLARSLPAPGAGAGARGARGAGSCGRVHWAARVASWRHFVHCAHALRACGRGDCANVCTERRLELDEDSADEPPAESPHHTAPAPSEPDPAPSEPDITPREPALVPTRAGPAPAVDPDTGEQDTPPAARRAGDPAPTPPAPAAAASPASSAAATLATRPRAPPARSPPPPPAPLTPPRPVFDWEPGRADFRAGDYGDNAAQYAVAEEPPPPRPAPRARPPAPRRRQDQRANLTLPAAPDSAAAPAAGAAGAAGGSGAVGNDTRRVAAGSGSSALTSTSIVFFSFVCVAVK
ncbi:guanine nucleotide-binding protein G(s) subunit alpha isoforms XLas [Plutella xylostella]|uniref:guanine nucleotide-binding protein G(s) subunit alpha isoforms XLas n=1 Tax=Plutella xylostella TaxID=51655 RepID=UPI002032A88D|nr:guanine nucleotide-binding protein G(s) subunit alpha isoforms XLas [Plutella xylostella]